MLSTIKDLAVDFSYQTTLTFSVLFLVPPRIRPLQDMSPIIHSDLNVTCIVEGDPVPSMYWLKNGAHVIPRAQLSADNRTLVISDVDISVGGVYTCVAVNRAGNDSSSAAVEVLSEYMFTILT